MKAQELIGRRFTLRAGYRHTIERGEYDFGGETGVVVDATDNNISFKLDKRFPVLDEWNNELVFDDQTFDDGSALGWFADAVAEPEAAGLEWGYKLTWARAAFLEAVYKDTFGGKEYTLNGEEANPIVFMVVNQLTDQDRGRITRLKVGQEIVFGGGAGEEFVLRRTS